jgi:Fic-DOC domain mobile mystery protein B
VGDVNITWAPIEGETPIDPSGLKNRSVFTRAELNRIEAENIRKAHVKYFASRPTVAKTPFDFTWMCRLHGEMFGDVWVWAGEPRTVELNFGVPVIQVLPQLYDLAETIAFWKNNRDLALAEQTARLHHTAVLIHPFCNGNGRWARMLANIWQYAHSGEITKWPEDKAGIGEIGRIRSEYLAALRTADTGDFGPLLQMHERLTGPA